MHTDKWYQLTQAEKVARAKALGRELISRWISRGQLAGELGISEQTLMRWLSHHPPTVKCETCGRVTAYLYHTTLCLKCRAVYGKDRPRAIRALRERSIASLRDR